MGAALSRSADGPSAQAEVTVSLQPAGDPGAAADSLATLAQSLGGLPRVLLRDTDGGSGPDPLIQPASPEMPELADRSAHLQLFGEIARGGMGAVLKGRDTDIGRDLAVKVLLERHRGNPDLARRFVEEAQIAGQLQHPGVVPVYELGAFADLRPYFAMKLVKGHTLAALLEARSDRDRDLPRFLGVFEAVSQTIAYAHARGVIHRDLKPSNVMVGAFGEVQVMDWGLAKVLPKGGTAADASAGKAEPQETVTVTVRSGSDSDLSRAGSVLGTPAYMAPEQARGEVDRLDERCDVFALGSILCAILTGAPAFLGRSSAEVQRQAARGDTADALARLDACGADAELVTLARDCLAREPEDRPRDARAVADRQAAHRLAIEARLHAAERERAVAQARAEEEAKRRVLADQLAAEAQAHAAEERRRRRLQLGLAASILALTMVGGLTWSYVLRQRQARAAAIDLALGRASTLLEQARQAPEEPSGWRTVLAAVAQVADDPRGVGPEARARLTALRAQAGAGLRDAERDATLRQALVEVRANRQDAGDAATDAAYADAFRAADLDIDALDAEAAARLRRRPAAVVVELAAFLDDWSAVRRAARPSADAWKKPLEVARAADADAYRGRLRALLEATDDGTRAAKLKALIDDTRSADLPAATAVALAEAVGGEARVALLERAVVRHPGDLWVNFALAGALRSLRPSRPEEALRHYTAARALRPETAHDLADLLVEMGRGGEAEAIFRDLVERRPENPRHLTCFGKCLQERGRTAEASTILSRAIASARVMIDRRPGDGEAHYNLGNALGRRGEHAEAIAEYREAIRLKPDYAAPHYNLGNLLFDQKKFDAAIVEYREAIRLRPDFAGAYISLGNALDSRGEHAEAIAEYREAIRLKPDYALPHYNLGNLLLDQKKFDAAIVEYREAIRLRPDYAEAHNNLGNALDSRGEHAEAIAEYREAIRLRPDVAEIHFNLGHALGRQGKHAETAEAYRDAIRLRPDDAVAHYNLGHALGRQGKHAEAAEAYREAIRLRPDYAMAHCNLGAVLRRQGEYAESLAEYRRGHELGSKRPDWPYPSAEWVRQAERMVELASRLPGVVEGRDRPRDAAEALTFADICTLKHLYAAAARLFAEALEADPTLGDDRQAQHRYNAACAAALAGCGRGKDQPTPDEPARAALRARALDWLKAELAAWSKLLDSGPPQARPMIAQTLGHWQADADLAGVRDPEALDKLPEAERAGWRALWAEVDRMLDAAKRAP
jgi:serine/threonine-protein kinase